MEKILSGYCRTCDASRMVLVDAEEMEADCEYPDCPQAAACPIAVQIRAFLEESTSVRQNPPENGENQKK